MTSSEERLWQAVGPMPKSWDGERMIKAALHRCPNARAFVAHPDEEARLHDHGVMFQQEMKGSWILPGYVYCDVGPDG